MNASRRGLIVASITEIIGVSLYIAAKSFDLPIVLAAVSLAMHYPAICTLMPFRSRLGDVEWTVAVVLLQWLLWIGVLCIVYKAMSVNSKTLESANKAKSGAASQD